MLRKIGHIFPEAIRQFRVALSPPIDITSFHRTRDPAIYVGPRVVVARGIDTDRRMRAAFLSEPASFSESVFATARLTVARTRCERSVRSSTPSFVAISC
jgi:hypothetical protein